MPPKFEKPAPLKPATSDDFAEALKDGNAQVVADVLCRLGRLSLSDCELLADHFVGKPSKLFPFRLKFVRGRRGRPAGDQFKKLQDDAKIKQVFDDEYAKTGKFEAAIKETMDKTKHKRTRVTAVVGEQKSK
jgi:hypothetical protein